MNLIIPDAISGESLKLVVFSETKKRIVYAEGLIYELSSLMLSADPGTGKSLLSLVGSIQLASGLPLFGALTVPKAIKVYYIQKERPQLEIVERLKVIAEVIDINWDNLIIDSNLQFMNLSNLTYSKFLSDRIKKFNPNLIVIDPIGAGTPGISKDEIANNFCTMMTTIQNNIGNAFWFNNHTTRESYLADGSILQKAKPFYGSQWIDAFVTGHYHVTKSDAGTNWRKTKDTYNILLDKIKMSYEPDTYCSYLKTDMLSVKDKILNYVNSVKSFKKTFTFNDLRDSTGCVTDSLRHTLRDRLFDSVLKRHKSSGEATLYEILQ